MKFSFNNILIITCVLAILSCTKEGAADATQSSGKGGSLAKFTIAGDFLYAVDSRHLYTYNISNPADPIKTNTSYLNFDVETIYPFKNRLFIGARNGLYIFSIDTADKPVKLGQVQHFRSCDPVVANDNYAFVTLKGGSACGPAISGLYVYDISNVANPTLNKTVEIPNPEGLGLQGTTLYICCNNNGLRVYNVAVPNNPVLIKTISGSDFKDVIPYNDMLICYVSTGIKLYDITNPQNPLLLTHIPN